MQKIPKQEYTAAFKEQAVKHVKDGKPVSPTSAIQCYLRSNLLILCSSKKKVGTPGDGSGAR